MLKYTFKILVSIIIIIFSASIIKIDNTQIKDSTLLKIESNINKQTNNVETLNTQNIDNDIIGNITIEKLHINNPLYNIDNPKNNIEQNITILKQSILPDKDNSILFIAAHSGTGHIAFFKDLNRLKENDEVIITYNNIKYTYIVKSYWEQEKNGYININKSKEKQLILTTCSPHNKNYQLIVNCILKS